MVEDARHRNGDRHSCKHAETYQFDVKGTRLFYGKRNIEVVGRSTNYVSLPFIYDLIKRKKFFF